MGGSGAQVVLPLEQSKVVPVNQMRQKDRQMRLRHSNRGASHPLLLLQSVAHHDYLEFGGCESMGLSEPNVPGLSSVTSTFDKKQESPGCRISVLKADEKGSISAPEAAGPNRAAAVTNASWS